jgi:hypothetical protein
MCIQLNYSIVNFKDTTLLVSLFFNISGTYTFRFFLLLCQTHLLMATLPSDLNLIPMPLRRVIARDVTFRCVTLLADERFFEKE